jgi:hypothetical protein
VKAKSGVDEDPFHDDFRKRVCQSNLQMQIFKKRMLKKIKGQEGL